jgi:predicted outer membrane repeat protein
LRDAIRNAAPNATIDFAAGIAGSTITLTSGEIATSVNNLTIDGGTNNITISGNNASRIFDFTGTNITETIKNLTLKNGSAPGNTEPNTGKGGAIYSQGSLTLTSNLFANNSARNAGGAVYSIGSAATGTVTINGVNSKFNNNSVSASTTSSGGAVEVSSGGAATNNVVISSTGFTGNSAAIWGAP